MSGEGRASSEPDVDGADRIGRRLQLRQSGVRAHISALVRELGGKGREEAIAFMRETTR